MMAVGEEEAAAASVEGPSREKWLMLDFFWEDDGALAVA